MKKNEDSWIEITNHCSDDKEELDHFVDAILLTHPTEENGLVLHNQESSISSTSHIDSIFNNWFNPSSEIHRFGFLDNHQQNHLSSSTPVVDNLIPTFSFSASTQNNDPVVTMPDNSMSCDHRRRQTSSLCYCMSQWESISKPEDVNYFHHQNTTPNNSFINSAPIDVIPINTCTNSVPDFRCYGAGIGAIFRNTNINSNTSQSDYTNHSIVNYTASCSRQERVFTDGFMNIASTSMKKYDRWTEDEHKRFLAGLRIYGKGDWKRISQNLVITKSPSQIASHAQKFFERQKSPKEKQRRPSIHDRNTVDDAYVISLLADLHNRASQSQPANSVPLQMPFPSRPPTPPTK